MRFLITMSTLLLAAAPSLADCRRVAVVKRHVAPAVVVEKQPVLAAVFVPLVGVSYAPAAYPAPAYPGAPAPANADTAALAVLVQQLQQEIQQLRSGQSAPATAAITAPDPGLAVLASRCAKCHDGPKAADVGGGFTLLAGGKLAPGLTGDQLLSVLSKSHDGSMPPTGPNLSTEERKHIAALVRQQLKAAQAPASAP